MDSPITYWEGFPVEGDTHELDFIVETAGMLALDKNDILTTLSSEGGNYIATGIGQTLGDAFKSAKDSLPIALADAERMIIHFIMGTHQPDVSEIGEVVKNLGDNDRKSIVWGISSDSAIGEKNKVSIIISTK